jgi:uncharacterized protein (DUF2147 family)
MLILSPFFLMPASLFLAPSAPAAPAPPTVPAAQASPVIGSWKNPKGTVIVRTDSCGANLCGTVVWASPDAIADARDGGTGRLVGTQLLHQYHLDRPGHWTGDVYVPNMGRSFYSTIVQKGPNRLVIAGCIFHGFICRHQEWSRI